MRLTSRRWPTTSRPAVAAGASIDAGDRARRGLADRLGPRPRTGVLRAGARAGRAGGPDDGALALTAAGGAGARRASRGPRRAAARSAAQRACSTSRSWSRRASISRARCARLADARWPLTGASDHLVSEALYLRDPDGNGIEIYRDRPRAQWPRRSTARSRWRRCPWTCPTLLRRAGPPTPAPPRSPRRDEDRAMCTCRSPS